MKNKTITIIGIIMLVGFFFMIVESKKSDFVVKIKKYEKYDKIKFNYDKINYNNYYLYRWSDDYFECLVDTNDLNNSKIFEWKNVDCFENYSYLNREKTNEMNDFMKSLNKK